MRRWTSLILVGVALFLFGRAFSFPVLGIGGMAAGVVGLVGAVLSSRDQVSSTDLNALRVQLNKKMGDPRKDGETVEIRKSGRNTIVVKYPATFDDHSAMRRVEIADVFNAKISGRWKTDWDTEKNMFTARRRPEMPDRIDRPHKTYDHKFSLGPDEDGRIMFWEPRVMPHALVVGSTGSGKSVLLNGLIMEACAAGWTVLIADGKGTTLAGFRNWPGVKMSGFGEAEEMGDVLIYAKNEVLSRYDKVRKGEVDGAEEFDPILVVIDEAAQMTKEFDRWWRENRPQGGGKFHPAAEAWRDIARIGREAGVHLLFGIQQAAASFFDGTEARDNFACRISLGPTTQSSAIMAFGNPWAGRDIPQTAKGRATVNVEGDGSYREVQTYYSPELKARGQARNERDEKAAQRWYAMAREVQPVVTSAQEPVTRAQTRVVLLHELAGDIDGGTVIRIDGTEGQVHTLDPTTEDPDNMAELVLHIDDADNPWLSIETSWETLVEVVDA